MAVKRGSGTQLQNTLQRSGVEELLVLIEVYDSLPDRALAVTLEARGLGTNVNLKGLDRLYLIALAVHTHRVGWEALRRLRFTGDEGKLDQGEAGPQMLDAPV